MLPVEVNVPWDCASTIEVAPVTPKHRIESTKVDFMFRLRNFTATANVVVDCLTFPHDALAVRSDTSLSMLDHVSYICTALKTGCMLELWLWRNLVQMPREDNWNE